MAIRDYLNTARAAFDHGDRRAALAALNAALALDPHYLAAQAMKEQVEGAGELRRQFPDSTASPRPTAPPIQWPRLATPPAVAPPPPEEPVVSAEGWARFERRARARRAEKRAAAARALIARGRFLDARAALAELRDIDSAHPELISLSIELDAAEHLQSTSPWRWGPAVAATIVFGALLLGARYVEMPGPEPTASSTSAPPAEPAPAAEPERTAAEPTVTPLQATAGADRMARLETAPPSRVPRAAAPAAPDPAPAPPATSLQQPPRISVDLPRPTTASQPTGTPASARRDPFTAPVTIAPPVAAPVAVPVAPVPAAPEQTAPEPDVRPAIGSPAVAPAALPGAVTAEPPPDAPATARLFGRDTTPAAVRTTGAVVATVPEEERVRRTLQLYQRAYESLDAQSAQAVWPRVDGVALQRAFDGLASQRLTFENCDVQVRGSSGSAVCHGTARYVPKVGSREPRIEPRTWTFALRKAGEEWQIDTARAER